VLLALPVTGEIKISMLASTQTLQQSVIIIYFWAYRRRSQAAKRIEFAA
jgi:hypothetical protein